MPMTAKSGRVNKDELLSTPKRSPARAQRTFAKATSRRVALHGTTDSGAGCPTLDRAGVGMGRRVPVRARSGVLCHAVMQPRRSVRAMRIDGNPTDMEATTRGWWRRRSRRQRRLILVGILVLFVAVVPGVRSALAELLATVLILLALVALLGLLAAMLTLRIARRHPLVDVLIGAWLMRRHERRHERRREVVDARSWSGCRPDPYEDPRGWLPPDVRSWRR